MLQWDVDSITSRVVARLQGKASFAQILPFSTNMRLITAFAEEISDLANYDEYTTRENTWSLARNRSSLLASQAIHRYNAYRKIGASGTIRVAVSDLIQSSNWLATLSYNIGDTIYYLDILYTAILGTNINNIPVSSPTYWTATDIKPADIVDIPKWTTFSDEGGTYNFTTYEANFLTTSDNFLDVNVIQGTYQTFNYTALGNSNEEIIIPFPSIENTYYEVWVNGVQWTEVDALLDSSSADKSFELEDALDFQKLYIKFGDDTYGKKLSVGDAVIFRYISTLGVSGNINSSNIIVKVVSTLRYVTSNSVVDAKCTNIDPLLGGQDEEDIENIRVNAPKIFESGERASNNADYQAIILNNFSFVSKVLVWGAYELALDAGIDPWLFDPLQENIVHVAAVSTGDTNLTYQQKYDISTGINTYKAPTDIVVYESVRFVNVIFTTIAYVSNTTYTLSGVSAAINTALTDAYLVSNMDIHEDIYFSDYQTLIDQVAGVNHHTTFVELSYESLFNDPLGSSTLTADPVIPSVNLKDGTVKVFIKDLSRSNVFQQVAHNSGSSFIADAAPDFGTLTLTGSSIDLTLGIMALVATNFLYPTGYQNYTIRVQYRLNQDDLLLQERADIFSYQSSGSSISAQYIRY